LADHLILYEHTPFLFLEVFFCGFKP